MDEDTLDDDTWADREHGGSQTNRSAKGQEQTPEVESEAYERVSPKSEKEFKDEWEVIEDFPLTPEVLEESKAAKPLAKKDRLKVVDVASVLATIGAPSSSSDQFQATEPVANPKVQATARIKERDRPLRGQGQSAKGF